MNAVVDAIQTIPFIPPKDERQLSIHLERLTPTEVWPLAESLGFVPELVRVAYGNRVELHAMLWRGKIAETPRDLEARVDALADTLDNDAIRHCWGAVDMTN